MSAIDGYVRSVPAAARGKFKEVLRAVKRAAPGAEAILSYRIPAFRYRKRILVYLGAFEHHIGLFPPPPPPLRKAAARYAGPKGNLRFPLDRAMPLALIARIVKCKVKALNRY